MITVFCNVYTDSINLKKNDFGEALSKKRGTKVAYKGDCVAQWSGYVACEGRISLGWLSKRPL